jgi:four helix bundle protein
MEAAPTRNFRELVVWQKAHQLVLEVYRLTAGFPRHELYGLSAQLRRSTVSVAANIVEGYRKRGRADKARFLNIAEGSLEESRYYLILAADLGYSEPGALIAAVDEVCRLLSGYVTAIMNHRT